MIDDHIHKSNRYSFLFSLSFHQKIAPYQIRSINKIHQKREDKFLVPVIQKLHCLDQCNSQPYDKKTNKQFKWGKNKKLRALVDQRLNINSFGLFFDMINYSNKVKCGQTQTYSYYVHIAKGNNHYLIHSIFKQRWWWKEIDSSDLSKVNFSWGQLRNNRMVKMLEMYGQEQDSKKNVNDYYELILNEKTLRKRESVEYRSIPEWVKQFVNKKDICALLEYIEKNNMNGNDLRSILNDEDFINKELKQLNVSISHNHIEDNWNLGNKKALFYNMRTYYQAINQDYTLYMPTTFHIFDGKGDKEHGNFAQFYKQRQQQQLKNIWIIKPGEMTNRGKYEYKEGYIRTSSKEFQLANLDLMIHLTNDAVQQKDATYGKYESGNKVSFHDFQKYLDSEYRSSKINFYNDLYSQMQQIASDTIKASHHLIDPNRRSNSFELYGLDFMIDSDSKFYSNRSQYESLFRIIKSLTYQNYTSYDRQYIKYYSRYPFPISHLLLFINGLHKQFLFKIFQNLIGLS